MNEAINTKNAMRNSLLRLRVEHDLTESELADKLGLSVEEIIEWEIGDSAPDIESIAKIANLYGVSAEEILTNRRGAGKTESSEKQRERNASTSYSSSSQSKKYTDIVEKIDTVANSYNWYAFPYPIIVLSLYLASGFLFGMWGTSWLMFLTIPIYYQLIACLRSRGSIKTKAFIFPYPTLAIFLYTSFGIEFGIWSPTWLIFLTIPFYYMMIAFMPGKK